MKMLKYIFYFLLGIALFIGGLGLFAKKTYHIERSIVIDAPKALVYEQVKLFKNFHEWSPWSKLDTSMQLTYAGTDGEVGASYSWIGNKDVGEGKQTLKTISPDRLEFQLDIVKPFESSIPVFFNFKGDEQKTKVTWGFDPSFPFPINVWAMFTDIDKAMGTDYEHGLGYLKRRCEIMAHKKYHGYEIAEEEMPIMYYLCARKMVPMEEIGTYYAEFLPKLMAVVTDEKLTLEGAPSGLYWSFDKKAGKTDMAAALPIKEEKKQAKDFEMYKIEGGKALVLDYLGDYSMMEDAHKAMDEYMTGNRLKNVPPVIEAYVTDPAAEPDTAKWLTKVIYYVVPMPDTAAVKK